MSTGLDGKRMSTSGNFTGINRDRKKMYLRAYPKIN